MERGGGGGCASVALDGDGDCCGYELTLLLHHLIT